MDALFFFASFEKDTRSLRRRLTRFDSSVERIESYEDDDCSDRDALGATRVAVIALTSLFERRLVVTVVCGQSRRAAGEEAGCCNPMSLGVLESFSIFLK